MSAHLLQAARIRVTFDGRTALDGVDLSVRTGEVIGVTGASGSGKTTLLRVLAGLHAPDAGAVLYDGEAHRPTGSVALVAQHPRQVCNPRWTLRRIVTEPAAIRRAPADPEVLAERVGLDEALLDRHPGQVSDGQLQRACLARVLVQRPRFVLCDEPTAMLDPIAAADVVALLRGLARDSGLVVVSHDAAVVEALSDRVVRLSSGRLTSTEGPGVADRHRGRAIRVGP